MPRLIHAGELLIADKAFVKLQALRDIQQAGGYFLLPWPRSVGLYQTQPDGTPQALDLAVVLRASTSAVFERPAVQLGAPAEAIGGAAGGLSLERSQREPCTRRLA